MAAAAVLDGASAPWDTIGSDWERGFGVNSLLYNVSVFFKKPGCFCVTLRNEDIAGFITGNTRGTCRLRSRDQVFFIFKNFFETLFLN